MRQHLWTAASVALVFFTGLAFVLAQPEKPKGEKYALIVGVQDYGGTGLSKLKYCDNDAHDLADLLASPQFGFDKKNILVLTQRAHFVERNKSLLPKADNIRAWLKTLKFYKPEDTLIVAFSGHGVQLKQFADKGLFFCPEECDLSKPETLVSLTDIYDQLDKCKAGVKILIMDACRNDPSDGKGTDDRLESLSAPQMPDPKGGIAAFFSCSKGEKSYESDTLKHGIFTYHVIEGLKGAAANREGNVTIPSLEDYLTTKVPQAVIADLKNPKIEQTPERRGKIVGSVVLYKGGDAIKDVVAKLSANEIASKTLPGLKLVRIAAKGKTFTMGSPPGEKGRSDDEAEHDVTFSTDYYMGVTTVTKAQFAAFVKDADYKTDAEKGDGGYGWDDAKKTFEKDKKYSWQDPGFKQDNDHPVVNVSWNDAVAFCEWLSGKDNRKYGLPTEAQWEYACRAGSRTRFYFGDDEEDLAKHGNVADASFRSATKKTWGIKADDGYAFTAPVGKFPKNAFGLYDTHGNVYQWCSDVYGDYPKGSVTDPEGPAAKEGSYRVLRGGSWGDDPQYCRSAYRYGYDPTARVSGSGFRLAVPRPVQ